MCVAPDSYGGPSPACMVALGTRTMSVCPQVHARRLRISAQCQLQRKRRTRSDAPYAGRARPSPRETARCSFKTVMARRNRQAIACPANTLMMRLGYASMESFATHSARQPRVRGREMVRRAICGFHAEDLAPCAKLVIFVVLAYLSGSRWQSTSYQHCFVCLPRPRVGCRLGAWTYRRIGKCAYDSSCDAH